MARGKCRGFATFTALVLMGILSIVIGLTVELIKTDAFRTRDELNGTQLRQLLLSGQMLVNQQLGGGDVREQTVPLSAELNGATLQIHPLADKNQQDRAFVLQAMVNGSHAQQTVRYQFDGQRWKLTQSTME